MLEEREQVQATVQHGLARVGTRILAVGFAVLAIGFFSFSDNREAVASMFREAPSEPAPPAKPPPTPAKPAPGQESAADELIRTANDVTAGPLAAPVSPDGKVVSKEDIGFAMELLNFTQGPRTQEAPRAEKKEK
jgi:hypothetical protein